MHQPIHKWLVLAPLISAGCGLSEPVVCTDEAVPSIHVEIRDSVTNALVGAGARVIAADGSYADTAFASSHADVVSLAHERPGNYTVTVAQTGYQVWNHSAIQVRRGICHVQTVAVVARLQP